MPIIDLKQQYPHLYDETLMDVPQPIFEVFDRARKDENNYDRRRRYHHGYYSLDACDGMENNVTHRSPSPEEVFMQKTQKQQLQEALDHLPPIQSRRIHDHFMLGKTMTAIAKAEGVTKNCISSSIRIGLKNIKRYYKKHHWEAF